MALNRRTLGHVVLNVRDLKESERFYRFLDPDGNRVEIACNANKFDRGSRKGGK